MRALVTSPRGCESEGPYAEDTVCPSNLYSRHNLWMDCSKIKAHGIHFNNTIDGLRQCIKDYDL